MVDGVVFVQFVENTCRHLRRRSNERRSNDVMERCFPRTALVHHSRSSVGNQLGPLQVGVASCQVCRANSFCKSIE